MKGSSPENADKEPPRGFSCSLGGIHYPILKKQLELQIRSKKEENND